MLLKIIIILYHLIISERTYSGFYLQWVSSKQMVHLQSSASRRLGSEDLDSSSTSRCSLLPVQLHVRGKVISLSKLGILIYKAEQLFYLRRSYNVLMKHEGALKSRKCHENVNNVYTTLETNKPEIYRYHCITHFSKISGQPRCRVILSIDNGTQGAKK